MKPETELERLEREYVEAGYDLQLLESSLRMTPDERVKAHESAAMLALELRRAMEDRNARLRGTRP